MNSITETRTEIENGIGIYEVNMKLELSPDVSYADAPKVMAFFTKLEGFVNKRFIEVRNFHCTKSVYENFVLVHFFHCGKKGELLEFENEIKTLTSR